MKHFIALFIFTLLCSRSIQAQATKAKVYGDVATSDDQAMKKMLAIPEVKAQYDSCTKANVKLEEMSNCLWNGGSGVPPLSDDAKKQVKNRYAADEATSGRSPASAPTDPKAASGVTSKLTGNSDNLSIDYKSDPAVRALTDFYNKKLNEVLNPDANNKDKKTITTVDQSKFIQLYSSELGKSVVNSFVSYCMETSSTCGSDPKDPSLCEFDKVDGPKNAKKNLDDLKTANLDTSAGTRWTSCIASVSGVCYDLSVKVGDDNYYSKQKACLVVDFVKAARKNLMIAEEQKQFYDGLTPAVGIASNMKAADENSLAADKITSITSSDVGKDFQNTQNKKENIAKVDDDLAKEAEECAKDGTSAKCKNIIDTNVDAKKEAVAEFGLRKLAQEDDLSKKLDDPKAVAQYLKEEGYDDAKIKDLTSTPQKLEEIKDQIKKRFDSEKEAIIAEMAQKVNGKITSNDGKIDLNSDSAKISAIKQDFSSRSADLKNLIQFDNIVSSYLTVVDSKNTKATPSRNTASLYAELKGMDPNTAEAKALKAQIEASKDVKETSGTADLSVDQINELLKYK